MNVDTRPKNPRISSGSQEAKGPFEMAIDWRLEPRGESTRLFMEMTAESGAGKFFGKFADSVVIRIAKRDRQTSPDKLKDVLEAEPT
jgi:hypothetical protein